VGLRYLPEFDSRMEQDIPDTGVIHEVLNAWLVGYWKFSQTVIEGDSVSKEDRADSERSETESPPGICEE